VLRAGDLLTPVALGVAASLGRAKVKVHHRPKVAVLATGDELVEAGVTPGPGQIVASTSYVLQAAISRLGAEPVYLGIARDTREDLKTRLSAGLSADALLTTGGVSVGEKDFVKEVLDSLGGEMSFWRVEQRPGYPLAFGLLSGKPCFGLPGNPVSTMVSFEEYVQPALLKMAGRRRLFPPLVKATLEEDLSVKPGKTWFLRGVLAREGDGFRVRSTGGQGSNMLTSLLKGNSLIVLPPDRSGGKAGETVTVQVIDPGFWLGDEPGF